MDTTRLRNSQVRQVDTSKLESWTLLDFEHPKFDRFRNRNLKVGHYQASKITSSTNSEIETWIFDINWSNDILRKSKSSANLYIETSKLVRNWNNKIISWWKTNHENWNQKKETQTKQPHNIITKRNNKTMTFVWFCLLFCMCC